MAIGLSKKKENVQDLLTYYASTKRSVSLKKAVMWALVQCQAQEGLPLFLADLDHEDAGIRQAAYGYIKAYFVDFPPTFSPQAADAKRKAQDGTLAVAAEHHEKDQAASATMRKDGLSSDPMERQWKQARWQARRRAY